MSDTEIAQLRRKKPFQHHLLRNRPFHSGQLLLPSNREQPQSLGDFVEANLDNNNDLSGVLEVFPSDMPFFTFCKLDPNSVTVENESLREKVILAIHAARASLTTKSVRVN